MSWNTELLHLGSPDFADPIAMPLKLLTGVNTSHGQRLQATVDTSVVHNSYHAKKGSHTRLPVLGSQPAGDASHTPGSRLPLLPARPAVTPATLKRAATNFAAW